MQQEPPLEKNKAKRAAKAAERVQRDAKKAAVRVQREAVRLEKKADIAKYVGDNFGDRHNLTTSSSTSFRNRKWTRVEDLMMMEDSLREEGNVVLVRGRIHGIKNKGGMAFVMLRSGMHTIQLVLDKGNKAISPKMMSYVVHIPCESVVDVEGTLVSRHAPPPKQQHKEAQVAPTIRNELWEIQVTGLWCVSRQQDSFLPFSIEDVSINSIAELDHRWLSLRRPVNQAIFRMESMLGCLFREYMMKHRFIEMHTPKIVVSNYRSFSFDFDYFHYRACLAKTPQFHQQMAVSCSGFERVFTTGPSYINYPARTARDLCECTSFDFEMTIYESYEEEHLREVVSNMFLHILDGIHDRCQSELELIHAHYPHREKLKYSRPLLLITFEEGCTLLANHNVNFELYDEDMSDNDALQLADIIRKTHDTDVFIVHKYPSRYDPFYIMPCEQQQDGGPAASSSAAMRDDVTGNPCSSSSFSNTYCLFVRGEVVMSGSQRIHQSTLLEERYLEKMEDDILEGLYLDSFRNGAFPHAGGSLLLERTVQQMLGLDNIRKTSWFPRDCKRLVP